MELSRCPICGVFCGSKKKMIDHMNGFHSSDLASGELIQSQFKTELPQKEQWVEVTTTDGQTFKGIISEAYHDISIVELFGLNYTPGKLYKRFFKSYPNNCITPLPSDVKSQDIDMLIDLALAMHDEEWFRKLTILQNQ
ncbi:IDEAL domain-containing protein [Paenisporosarcina antarctica]|uniref:IDEAL domain-containing protein n=1 Tax=Paenisporosarcina antarctica TaxID=417367 RepID=A0A4P6ZXM2_9BACL|nr:IDEAL domain-containing protein [Paenisporosarcina antarctica]QBP41023.1 IDEAL domain-containing protein [Paenisporosarcina antarctica]